MTRYISQAAIRRAWFDMSQNTGEAASSLGITRCTLQRRAVALGLPPRPNGRRSTIMPRVDQFRALWALGVGLRDLGAHFGLKPGTVSQRAMRMGLPPRQGERPRMTLAQALSEVAA